jgi:peptide/nickel transport system permease protein
MFGYLVRRIISGILVLLMTSVAVFALFFYGPSDPAAAMCPRQPCSEERLDTIRANLGLDEGGPRAYADYMKGIFAGRDLGTEGVEIECPAPCLGASFKFNAPVREYLWERFPATVSIALGAAFFIILIGVPMGILAARKRGTMADRGIVSASLFLNAAPYYLVALLAYLYLVSQWGLFPDSEYVSPIEEGPVAWAKGLLLPWLLIGITSAPVYARFGRGAMVDTLNEDFVRTAKAKGLTDRRVAYKHALRAAIAPTVTLFALEFATLLAGTVFTEQIFGIDGIGRAAINALENQDLPVISATVLIAAAFIVVANIVVDFLYTVIDPRVRL